MPDSPSAQANQSGTAPTSRPLCHIIKTRNTEFMTCCETKDSIDFIEIIKWITPVLLFFLGLFFNKLSERLKENRRLEKVESYFYELLYSLKSLISQEQDLIMDFKNKLNDWSENYITQVSGLKIKSILYSHAKYLLTCVNNMLITFN